jgi:hypothetical protein
MEGMRNPFRTSAGRPEGKRPLVRPRHIWEDKIGKGLMEIWWERVDWIGMTQDGDQ